eukprot:2222840-Amphidinium_carterae.1
MTITCVAIASGSCASADSSSATAIVPALPTHKNIVPELEKPDTKKDVQQSTTNKLSQQY